MQGPNGILKAAPTAGGYLLVMLGRGHPRYVHDLVLRAFVGEPKPDECARHYPDPDKLNCTLANLHWGTRAQNEADKLEHGTTNRGERHGNARLTETDVRRAFELRAAGMKQESIGKELGVSGSYISMILAGKRWSHIARNA